MERMGSKLNLSVKQSVTIGTMINFDGDGEGHGLGDDMSKWAFTTSKSVNWKVQSCIGICVGVAL